MTTITGDQRHQAVRTAEITAAAMGFQCGLAWLLARGVESATRLEDRELAPRPHDDVRPQG